MDVLESQIEALVFNYLSLATTINSFWTLVAVLTAAISFWGIRAVSCPLSPRDSDDDVSTNLSYVFYDPSINGLDLPSSSLETVLEEDENDDDDDDDEFEVEERHVPDEMCSTSWSASPVLNFAVITDGTVKRKQTVCFDGEDDEMMTLVTDGDQDDQVAGDEAGGEEIVQVYGGDDECSREGMLVMRRLVMEDLGWYRCQDLTSLNGNVVKLWDGVGRRSGSTLGRVGVVGA